MGIGHQPVKAVGMGREDQRGIVHRLQAARHGMAHQLRAFRPAIVEHVLAVAVDQREMRVQPGPGIFQIGFCHEAGGKAVAARQALDQHLEQPGIVGGAQGVVTMHHVDFELAETGFRGRGIGRNVHRLARVVEIGEEGVKGVQRADRQGLGRFAALARPGRGWHLQGLAAVVDQEKLQLYRDDRGQALRLEFLDHGAQRMARIAFIGAAVLAEHPDRQQRCGRFQPGHRHEAAFGGLQHAIRIALFKDQRAVVDVFAPDIQVQDGKRKPCSLFHNLVGIACRNAFAARLPIQVGRSHANGPHLGVLPKPVLHNVTSGRGTA